MSLHTPQKYRAMSVEALQRRCHALSLALKRDDTKTRDESRIDEVQISSHFRDLASAWNYYHTQAGSTWADVQAKVDEGFISIDHHPHTVRYDADGRAVIRTPIAVAQREAARKAQEKRSRICDLLFPAERVLKSVTTAIVLLARLYSRAAVRIKTKTALRELLARQLGRFETDLPYCYRGKPYYTDEHFAKEEAKKCNQRACCFVFNERTYYLVVLRKCRNSARATHWGMEDAPPHVMLFDVDVHLLTWPSLHPLLKDLFHLITSPPCK